MTEYFETDEIPGACSSLTFVEVWDDDILDEGEYDKPGKVTRREFIKDVYSVLNKYQSYAFVHTCLFAEEQSKAIRYFTACGFKFTEPTHNVKNRTTICMGTGTVADCLKKTTAIMKKYEKLDKAREAKKKLKDAISFKRAT